jgi:outer membrane biosynthesis protein TonB
MWLAALAALVLAAGGCEQQKAPQVAPAQKPAAEEPKTAVEETKEATKAAVEATKEATKEVVQETKAVVEETKEATKSAVEKVKTAVSPSPKTVVYEASNGSVTFDHQVHSSQLACDSCHTTDPPIKVELGKDKAHQLCKGCHQEKGAGPTQCNGCHKKG